MKELFTEQDQKKIKQIKKRLKEISLKETDLRAMERYILELESTISFLKRVIIRTIKKGERNEES